MQSADRPEIEFRVACDVIETVHFAEFDGFFDVTGNLPRFPGDRLIVSRRGLGLSFVIFFFSSI